jgi:hypothetical protein
MADTNHKVAIVVAVIGVTGTLGAALLANWDKVFGRQAQAGPTVAAGSPAQTTAQTTVQVPMQTPMQAPVQATAPAPATTAGPGVAPSLTGDWRDSTGPNNVSRVRQVGNSFQYARQGTLPNGTGFEASGSGTLEGRQVFTSYQARYANGSVSSGSCVGSVSADATRMELQCTDSMLGAFPSIAVRN